MFDPRRLLHAERLSAHEHELTYHLPAQEDEGGGYIIKLTQPPSSFMTLSNSAPAQAALLARLPDVPGVPSWLALGRLDDASAQALGLESSSARPWLISARAFLPGQPLSKLDNLSSRWPLIALKLAMRLRELHEVEIVHADLQPGNILIHDQALYCIDLPLLATSPNERGHVAGSAPFMAPELWRGQPPSVLSDLYALAALIGWMASDKQYTLSAHSLSQWASAHERGELELAPQLTGRLGGIISRMHSPHPNRRASLQELIDELMISTSYRPSDPVRFSGQPHVELTQTLLTSVATQDSSTPSIELLPAPKGAGKTRQLLELARRLELMGLHVLLITQGHLAPQPGHARAHKSGPWAPLLELLEALGQETSALSLSEGDQLHTFAQLSQALQIACEQATTPLVVLWDDLDQSGLDLQAWWASVVGQWPAPLSLIATHTRALGFSLPGARTHELKQPSIAQWGRWRAATSRAEVRDIPQGKWEQLLSEHGSTLGQLLAGLNAHLGLQQEASTSQAPEHASADDILSRVQELIQYRAHHEASIICAERFGRQAATPWEDEAQQLKLLELWISASLAAGDHEAHSAAQRDELIALRQRPSTRIAATLLLAELSHGLGQYTQGLEILGELELDPRADPRHFAQASRWAAQLYLSSGQLAQASQEATRGLLALGIDGPTGSSKGKLTQELAHLLLLRHAAQAINGDKDAIDALKELATHLDHPHIQAVLRARCHAYIALGLTRNDAREAATDAYLRALEEIESASLITELPTYLLNVGTAYHRQGRLGLAREYYARGTRVATTMTRPSTRAWLMANQANIDMTIGRLDDARDLMSRARTLAQEHHISAIDATGQAFEGYILFARGQASAALAAYKRCLEMDLSRLPQLKAEVLLHATEVHLSHQDRAQAQQTLHQSRQLIDEHDLAALRDLHGILRARKMWVDGDPMGVMGGVELFRRRLISARDAGNYRLILQQSPYLLDRLEREGMGQLHGELVELLESSKNAIAMGLTRELREDFFANLPSLTHSSPSAATTKERAVSQASPQRFSAAAPAAAATSTTQTHELIERFYRMLSLNEVILHTHRLEELWPRAMEIALSLSGAERGFLLLRADRDDEFRVVASRDINGTEIAQPHLMVSQTIAEEAARTGRTVITINAREDERFNVALSVVDLDLTSVLCVPVRDASGLLGALYMDHRFQPGIFHGESARMMEAFGHQLALAITNVERLEALDDERRALAQAQEQLQALLTEREAMLEGLEQRVEQLTGEIVRAKEDVGLRERFPEIAYNSRAMARVLEQVQRVARGDIPVVIIGESGTGKELIARGVHEASARASGPFVAFNCGAVTESLFESEMFGHIKGAFTGATMDRKGLFQSAHGGTIFLDELGELPLSMQVKLLRVLQDRKVRRVGSTAQEPIDVRIVAATNRNLMEMVSEGTFREDLYYRLAAFVLFLPPLRERMEDIPLIAHTLLRRVAQETIGRELRLGPEAALLLSQCPWPGNVRELENALRAACVLCDADEISPRELLPVLRSRERMQEPTSRSAPAHHAQMVSAASAQASPARRGRRPKADRAKVQQAWDRAGGDAALAAEFLGVCERTMYRYLNKFGPFD